MENQTFKVKNENFEGPIEVLLELIEKRKLFVNDVSLATVTDDFILYIQDRNVREEELANFLAIASTLILIKARSLLPNLELTPEENKSITDLERRVALYQIISNISNEITKEYGKKISFSLAKRKMGIVFAPDKNLKLEDLSNLIIEVKERAPKEEIKKPEAKVQKTISIAEVLSQITERIEKALENISNTVTFDSVQIKADGEDNRTQKIYTIVSFLGMLELVRRGFLNAEQDDTFSTISLSRQEKELSEEI